jgi:PBP1b-binding outer membrane lipoprotein LpoB
MTFIKSTHYAMAALLLVALSGCATWTTGSVDRNEQQTMAANKPTLPEKVQLFDDDAKGRKYTSLGDISVTVNKTTVFHADPTKELVNQKLRERAAELGADAVILVRHGRVGMSAFSWGSLEGKGRAVKFQP